MSCFLCGDYFKENSSSSSQFSDGNHNWCSFCSDNHQSFVQCPCSRCFYRPELTEDGNCHSVSELQIHQSRFNGNLECMVCGCCAICGFIHSEQSGCPSPLEQLCEISDVWELVCWFGSGSSVVCLTQVSKTLRSATVKTPAFECLAGLDSDGFLVPWQDRSNVLACQQLLNGWNPAHHFIVRSGNCARGLDREVQSLRAVEKMLSLYPDSINEEFHFTGLNVLLNRDATEFEYGMEDNYYYGAPARPSSACSDYDYGGSYEYNQFNPCERLLTPVLFPQAAHRRTSNSIAQQLYATPDEETSSSDEWNSTSSDESDSPVHIVRNRIQINRADVWRRGL